MPWILDVRNEPNATDVPPDDDPDEPETPETPDEPAEPVAKRKRAARK